MTEPECECAEGEGCPATSPGKGYFCTRKLEQAREAIDKAATIDLEDEIEEAWEALGMKDYEGEDSLAHFINQHQRQFATVTAERDRLQKAIAPLVARFVDDNDEIPDHWFAGTIPMGMLRVLRTALQFDPVAPHICIWTPNSDGFYDTGCGQAFTLSNEAGLEANGFKFCYGCGLKIEEKPEPEVETLLRSARPSLAEMKSEPEK